MKLSLVFELLLIFVLLAFAASRNVKKNKNNNKVIENRKDDDKLEDNSINKYCKCSEAYCNCCRDFQVPLVKLDGPGCASLMYLQGDKVAVSLSFGKRVITNRTLSGRKPSPVCMPLPGGISKFCGRVYNIARAGEEFRACLGLELQSRSTVEAAVRVSCFKFGPRGVSTEVADPLPLVPQDEAGDDDDDDDDDEDDFDLGDDDDDDDDDDDGEIDAVNDIDGADYTGFSLLGEDLLGDLFGSSGGKKTNKNKKKQAPLPTPSTTTKRPRPTRHPTRRPYTRRSTTQRTTTAKITTSTTKPQVNRRPTRRPTRRPNRPNRKPTTAIIAESTTPSTISTTVTTSLATENIISSGIQSTERNQPIKQSEQTFEPVVIVTQKPSSTVTASASSFEDSGLEMSLAHITGQLSVMPVTPIIPSDVKESDKLTTKQQKMNYEIVETITPKSQTTIQNSFASTSNDDMVQIVQSLDSSSAEHISKTEQMAVDESRSHHYSPITNNYYEGLRLKNNNRGNHFNYDDLDVLDLSEIGESVGHQLGIFGRNKRQHKNKNDNKKPRGENKDESDFDDILGLDTLDETLGFSGDNNHKNKKDRRRQNKMMRGIWSNA